MSVFRTCYVVFESKCVGDRISSTLRNHRGRILVQEKWTTVRGFRSKKTDSTFGPTPVDVTTVANTGPLTLRTLIKPLIFTVGFSTTAVVGCTIWQYESIRARARKRVEGSSWLSFWSSPEKKAMDWRQKCNDYWNQLPHGSKVFAPVLLLNVLVFAAWRVPKLQPFMLTYFASNPAAKVLCWPMLLSAFSHYSFFHLAANMFVLHSFSHSFVGTLGKEQAAALYLSAGVISSFSSYFHKVLSKRPGLSVGASGAIMAVLGYVCTQYPDTKLSIIFLPMITFPAGAAIKVILGLDFLGCLLGWRFFDHAGHLGGAIAGIFWANYGNAYIWQKREPILKRWHEMRQGV